MKILKMNWIIGRSQMSNHGTVKCTIAEFIFSNVRENVIFEPWLLSVLKDATGAFSANLKHSVFRFFWGSMPSDP